MKKITKEIGQYTFARYLSEFFLAARGFIIARFLGPSSYGIWNMLKVFISFAEYSHLGSFDAMSREIPHNTGRGHEYQNQDMKRVAFTYSFLLSLLLSVFVCVISFTSYFSEYRVEVQLSSLVFLCISLHWFNQHVLKGEKKIYELSWYMFGYAFLNTAVGLSLLFPFEIQGLLVGMVITFLILFVALYAKKHLEFRFSFDVKKYKKLIKIGYPILLLSLVFLLMQKIDSILVFLFLGSEMTGYYGLAAFITLVVHHIPLSLNTVLLPRMMYTLGKTKNIKSISRYLIEPHNILMKGIPILVGLIIINIPWVIYWLLPEYIPAISTLQVLSTAIFFSSLLSLSNNILIAMNKQKKLVKKLLLVLFLVIFLDIVAILLGFGILGVAFATSISLCIAYLVSMILALRGLGISLREIRKSLSYFAYFIIVLLLSLLASSYVVQNAIFVIFMIPLAIPLIKIARLHLWT